MGLSPEYDIQNIIKVVRPILNPHFGTLPFEHFDYVDFRANVFGKIDSQPWIKICRDIPEGTVFYWEAEVVIPALLADIQYTAFQDELSSPAFPSYGSEVVRTLPDGSEYVFKINNPKAVFLIASLAAKAVVSVGLE